MAPKLFFAYFEESLHAATPFLPAPKTLFSDAKTAAASIMAMLTFLKSTKSDTTITVGMLFRAWPSFAATSAGVTAQAGAVLEVAAVAAAVSASYYLGACIGALIYASANVAGDRLSSSDTVPIDQCVKSAAACGVIVPDQMREVLAHNTTLLAQRSRLV